MIQTGVLKASLRVGIAAVALCLLSCQSSSALPAVQRELEEANTTFSFNLLKQLVKEQPKANVFISPYSASTALQMVGTGAAGSTLTEMQKALDTTDLTEAAVEQGNKDLVAIINAKNTNFILTTANAIWYMKGMPIVPAFLENNQKYFGATVDGLNLSAPSTIPLINNWASEETAGKITNIVSSIPADARMILANAVYFLGSWESPFDTNLTADRSFYLQGGGQSTIPMMQQTGPFPYCETNGYQAIELPYKGGDLAMYVFLPGPNSTLGDLLSTMNAESWQQAINNDFMFDKGTIILPKFHISYANSLIPALEALGMKTAFTWEANFSKMSSLKPLYIGAVQQQAVVDVDELGTEAAAVTTITVVTTVAPYYPNPFQMIVNRPFLFFIVDRPSSTILFSGAVYNP
jgi:serpin B